MCRTILLFLHYSHEKCANTLPTTHTHPYHHTGCYAGVPATMWIGPRVVVGVRLGLPH
jgi:hypothetical protein